MKTTGHAVEAVILSAQPARLACVADILNRLYARSLTKLESFDALTELDDDTGTFVPRALSAELRPVFVSKAPDLE